MDLDRGGVLRKMRVGELEPGLQKEVIEFAGEMGYEGTLKSSSRLHILLDIYNAEKVKEKRSRKALKKAEKLIMKLAGLAYVAEARRPQKAERREFPAAAERMELHLSGRMKALFESIGIRDERVMAQAIELHGEGGVEERAGLLLASPLGQALVQKLFTMRPAMILEKTDDFVLRLDTLENNKRIVDGWCELNGVAAGREIYRSMPEILFEEYARISRFLRVAEPVEAPPAERKKHHEKLPEMHQNDLFAVFRAHGVWITGGGREQMKGHRPDGRTFPIPDRRAYSPQQVRYLIREAGISREQFFETGQRLGIHNM